MNGKQARCLRHHARKQTVGSPYREYIALAPNRKKTFTALHPDCTRAVYKFLKERYRKHGARLTKALELGQYDEKLIAALEAGHV